MAINLNTFTVFFNAFEKEPNLYISALYAEIYNTTQEKLTSVDHRAVAEIMDRLTAYLKLKESGAINIYSTEIHVFAKLVATEPLEGLTDGHPRFDTQSFLKALRK